MFYLEHIYIRENRIVGVIISVLAQSVVDRGRGSGPGLVKSKTIKLMCCFSTKRTTLIRRKNNATVCLGIRIKEWNDMFTRDLLFQ